MCVKPILRPSSSVYKALLLRPSCSHHLSFAIRGTGTKIALDPFMWWDKKRRRLQKHVVECPDLTRQEKGCMRSFPPLCCICHVSVNMSPSNPSRSFTMFWTIRNLIATKAWMRSAHVWNQKTNEEMSCRAGAQPKPVTLPTHGRNVIAAVHTLLSVYNYAIRYFQSCTHTTRYY